MMGVIRPWSSNQSSHSYEQTVPCGVMTHNILICQVLKDSKQYVKLKKEKGPGTR